MKAYPFSIADKFNIFYQMAVFTSKKTIVVPAISAPAIAQAKIFPSGFILV